MTVKTSRVGGNTNVFMPMSCDFPGLAINFDFVYTRSYKGNIVEGLSSKLYNKAARNFHCVFE